MPAHEGRAMRGRRKIGATVVGLGIIDDTVEFFTLVLGTALTADEKKDLVAFLRAL